MVALPPWPMGDSARQAWVPAGACWVRACPPCPPRMQDLGLVGVGPPAAAAAAAAAMVTAPPWKSTPSWLKAWQGCRWTTIPVGTTAVPTDSTSAAAAAPGPAVTAVVVWGLRPQRWGAGQPGHISQGSRAPTWPPHWRQAPLSQGRRRQLRPRRGLLLPRAARHGACWAGQAWALSQRWLRRRHWLVATITCSSRGRMAGMAGGRGMGSRASPGTTSSMRTGSCSRDSGPGGTSSRSFRTTCRTPQHAPQLQAPPRPVSGACCVPAATAGRRMAAAAAVAAADGRTPQTMRPIPPLSTAQAPDPCPPCSVALQPLPLGQLPGTRRAWRRAGRGSTGGTAPAAAGEAVLRHQQACLRWWTWSTTACLLRMAMGL